MGSFSKRTSRTDAPRATATAVVAALLMIAASTAAQEAPGPASSTVDQKTVESQLTTPCEGQASPATATAPGASPQAAAGLPAQPVTPPATASNPAGAKPGPSPITVEADKLEVEADGIKAHATGNVIVEWNTSKLRTEHFDLDQRERVIDATGGVEYESDEIRVTALSAKLDVDDETATLERVNLTLQDEPGRFGGEHLEKLPGRHVVIDEGYFTTCETDKGHPPDWELTGKHLDVRLDDYARARDARLRVRGVPVLYLPYVLFPTKETRQSGLLPFSLGTSTNRGILFTLPGYWAIDKHQDLTATAVVETSARLGIDGLYRYAPSRKRWGELHASYYNEEIRGEPKPDTPAVGVPDNRGSVELIHRELGHDWTGYADVLWVGDERFLREVAALEGDAPERDLRRTRRYTASRVGALMEHGFTSGGVEAVAYQDLVGNVVETVPPPVSPKTDPVLRDTQQKPVSGWIQTDRNIGPVALAVDSSLASFIREKGASGERLDLASALALPLLNTGVLRSSAWARGRGDVYAMQQRDVLNEDEDFLERLDTVPARGVFEGGVDLRTKLARDYAFRSSERWSGLYHSLEPFTGVRYAYNTAHPYDCQGLVCDDIPLFDRLEAISGRDVATYGVDSRFLLRRRPGSADAGRAPFELGRLSLSQSYNLSREVVDDHFSDIDLAAFLQPMQGLAVRTLTSYNVGAGQLRGANASLSWETGPLGPILRGPSSQIAAAYRYVRSDQASGPSSDQDELQSAEMLVRLDFTRNFALGLKGLYDIVSKSFVEKAVGVTFTSSCDCWSVGLGVVDRVNPAATGNFGATGQGSPDELQVRLAFELKGLGGFGSSVTRRTSPALDSVEYDDIGFWRAGW